MNRLAQILKVPALAALVLVCGALRAEASTPVLNINNVGYCLTSNPVWVITVTDADPNSQVIVTEYQHVSGSTWTNIWYEYSTDTDGDGNWWYASSPPDRVGEFYAEVIVNGQVSNRVWYFVGPPC
jgi:hypothetical protein